MAEFRELNTAVEQLAERSRKAYVAQKEFAENASHEMRTPLAIFQGKLELLMQTDPLTEEQAELITDLATASQRMARLNKGLILLTRIQNGQFPETEEIAVKKTAGHLLRQYQPQIEQKDLQLEKDWLDDITVTINPIPAGSIAGQPALQCHPSQYPRRQDHREDRQRRLQRAAIPGSSTPCRKTGYSNASRKAARMRTAWALGWRS